MPSTRRNWILPATIACLLWAATAHAQVTLDPRTVEFNPSPDHSSPTLVLRYDLEVYNAGGATPILTVSLGKPAPQSDGKIRVDLATALGTFLASGPNYESRVVAVSDANATGRSTVSNQFAFTASCSATITPTSSSIAGGAGTGTFTVSAAPGCAWTAVSMASWITITGGATGTGNGTVTYSVTANPSTTSRTGEIAAGGKTFSLTQAGSCSFTISPTSASWSASAASGSVSVTTTAGCAWSASSPVSWITFTGPTSGTGSGTVNYSVAANASSTARNTTLSIAGRAFTVNQAGVACSPTLSASGVTVGAGGGPGTVSVTAAGGCTWTASSGVSWITISGGSPGNGNGTVSYNVAANGSATSRSGNLTIAGQTYTVTQEGVTCSFGISPTSSNVPSTASTGSVSVSAPGACAWTATSGASWITITSGGSGSGNGSVNYSVAANTTVTPRTGSITVGGQTFTITQAAAPCTFSISPTGATAPSGASTGSIAVTVATGCTWSAVSNATSWITVTGGGSGNGNGTVTYSVAANTSTASRSGTITVAGQTFTINQSGVPCSFTISPTGTSVGSNASTGSIAVTTQTGCAWTAVSNATSWITVTGGGSGNGNGTVTYSIAANTSVLSRSGTITVAGQTFSVTQSGITCTFSISPTGASVGAGATSGTVGVTAPTGCTWTAASGASWLTITGGSSGNGNGNVTYSVAANGTTSPRTGTLTIAGHSFAVTQAGGLCTFSVSPTSATIPAAGESRTVNVTVQNGCAWTATSSASWVTITSGSGSGNGTINYQVAANTSTSSRSATIAVGSQIVSITQQGVPCSYTLTPGSISVGATSTSGTVTVTAQAGCAWTATSTASWITVTNGTGSGNGSFSYTIAANSSATSRIGSVSVAGQTFIVTQSGVPCIYSIAPIGASVSAAATSGTVAVTADPGCGWTATSGASWITVTSGGSGTGSGTVSYTVAANPATTARTGTVTIAGHTFTVTQAGVVCTFSVSPTNAVLSWAASSLPINVTTGGSCAWSASSSVPWITLAGGGGPGSGNATFDVSANTTGALRSGTLTVAGQTVNVTQASGSCTYTISPSLVDLGPDATNVQVTVTTQGGCPWSSSSNASWATFPSGGTGSGPGTVTVAVASNPDGLGRLATLSIAGRSLVLNQAGRQCSYSLAPTGVTVGSQGGTGSFAVTASAGCSWTPSASASWVAVSGGGTGNGNVTYTVSANTTGGSRSASITVANRSFAITQAGACTSSISPTNVTVGETATSGTVIVTASVGCAWNASSTASWLTITSGATGTGNGTVNYSVAANPGGPDRTGTLNIAGDVFTVVQSSCTLTVTPPSISAASWGVTTYALVRAGLSCSWTASTSTPWISLPSGTSGTGVNWVTIEVAPNPGGSTRTGSVNVSGQIVTVVQDGSCSVSVSPTTAAAPAAGGVQSVAVTTGPSCGWTATSQAGWITINPGSASGSGSASPAFTVQANPGAARTGTILVGGVTVTINQSSSAGLTMPRGLRVIP